MTGLRWAAAMVVAMTLFLPSDSTGAVSTPAAGFSIGLARDGKWVETLRDFAVADLTPAAGGRRLALHGAEATPAPVDSVAPVLSPEAVERNAALAKAAEAGDRLRRHVDAVVRVRGAEVLGTDADLGRLAAEYREGQSEVRARWVAIRSDFEKRGLPASVRDRQTALIRRLDDRLAEFDKALAETLSGEIGAGDRLYALLQESVFVRRPVPSPEPTVGFQVSPAPRLTRSEADALLGDTLSVRRPTPRSRVSRDVVGSRVAAGATGAAGGGSSGDSPPVPADLAATPEVQLTQEIRDQAAALGNSPLRLYEFVRNHVGFQAYLGSRKGSAYTLRQLAGNDTDQASLLIALLRAAGIPARYARGTVEMTPEQAMALTGVEDAQTAASILTTAGLNGVAIIDGGAVVAVRSTRVWVHAYVPYSNYRGTDEDQAGKVWIPLDPSFKAWSVNPGQDVLTAMGWNADAFLEDYLSTFHPLSPIEQLQADIQAWLDVNQPGTSVGEIERTLAVAVQSLGLLPASLPYQVLSVSGEFAELEDSRRYKVRFHMHDEGTTFIDHTVRLSDLAGRRLTIEYVGATPDDQAVIDSYGSIYETPPNGLEVKPVLKLDGSPIATGAGSIGMGYTHRSDMQFTAPTGASNQQPLVQNEIIAGNGQAIAFDTFLDGPPSPVEGDQPGPDVLVESVMHPTAVGYLSRVSGGLETAGRLMRMVALSDVSEAIVENSIKVTYSGFGVPLTFEWTGLVVDADRRIVGPFAVEGGAGKNVPFMKLTGYDGSTMENRIFEDTFGQEAVSTIKILQLANDAGIGVCTITTSIAAQCPDFGHSDSITAAVNAALAQGHHVVIPKAPIAVQDWSGTGYIDLTPSTGAAGYIISGGISGNQVASGGATVAAWDISFTCAFTQFSGQVTTPAADAPDPSAVFCATDSDPLRLEGTVTVTCRNGSTQTKSLKPPFVLPSPKAIAEDPRLGPGEYQVTLFALGETKVLRKIVIFSLELDEVTFGGGNHRIYRDNAGQGEYPSPHWKKGRAEQSPVAYTRGTAPAASARFKVLPVSFAGPFKIRATGPDGIALPEKTATAAGGVVQYPMTASGSALKNEVLHYPSFEWTWQSSHSQKPYCFEQASRNQLYATLSTPAAPKLFHTVVHAACSVPGATTPATAAANTWSQFAGPANFKTWDGRTLYYYKTGLPFATCYTTAGLLDAADGNGQCGAWAHLLQDAFSANGLSSQWTTATPTGDPVFMVRNWTFGPASYNTTPDWNWKLQFEVGHPEMVPVPAGSKYGDVTSLATLAGQNSTPPSEKVFARHFVIKYAGTYYDPSYGVTYSSQDDFEVKAVDGYAAQFPGDNPASPTKLILRARKSVTNGGAQRRLIQLSN